MCIRDRYEFIWTPSYDFVRDPFDSLAFNITFYVLDKAQNRAESKIRFVIENTVNEAELDAYKYSLYRSGPVSYTHLDVYKRQGVHQPQARLYRLCHGRPRHRNETRRRRGCTYFTR